MSLMKNNMGLRHKKYKKLFQEILSLFLALSVIYGSFGFQPQPAQAATYFMTQDNWSSGTSASTLASPFSTSTNTYYVSSTNITAGANVYLSQSSYQFTDDGATSTSSGIATGGGFSNGTNSTTTISGTGTGASVRLNKNTSSWTTQIVEDLTDDVGQATSISAIDTSNIFISYRDTTNLDLKFAKSTDGGLNWTTQVVDSTASVGAFTSISTIDANNIFISYYDGGSATNLKFAKSTDAGSNWTTQAVDSTSTVGAYSSISAINTSNIFISYYDSTNADLKFAKSTDAGSNWTTQAVDSTGTVGTYTSISAIDTNNIFISYYLFNDG